MHQNVLPLHFADVQLATGVRLRYAEQGDPSGHPLVLLHGYTDSWFSFSPVLPLLPPSYHVFALDQRGHGAADRPASGYGLRDFVADVIAFLDELGLNSATLVGHSMGSFIAQQVALSAPDRVARLVLIGSAANPVNEGIRELQAAVQTLVDPVPDEFAREFQSSTIYRPLAPAFVDQVVAESLKLPAHVWHAALDGLLAADQQAELSRILTPTLILWGEEDTVFPRAEQDRLKELLPHAQLKIYPSTGHALHWEQPEQFVRDLEEFLRTPSP